MKQQFHTWFNPENSFQMKLFLLFKPKLQRFIWAGLFLLLAQQAANAQVSGTVFRDYNANCPHYFQSQQAVRGRVCGHTAYNSAGTIVASYTTTSESAPNYINSLKSK
jgi:hypothetical protein